MATAGSLIFELAADVSRLRQDMARAQKEVNSSLASIARSTAISAAKAGWDFAQQFAKGFADNIQRAIDDADAIGKLSERIGVSTEALSAIRLQAQSAGTSLDAVTNALRGWSKASLDLQTPTSQAAAAIKALGLDVSELKQQDPAQAMRTIAEAMSGFKDGADKVNVARALFGKVGDELIPMLNQGAQGFDDWTQKARDLGAVIDQQTARAAADFNDELGDLKTLADSAWQQLASYLLPTLKELVTWFKEDIRQGGLLSETLMMIAGAANVAAQALVGMQGIASAAGKVWAGVNKLAQAPVGDIEAQRKARGEWKNDLEDARRALDIASDRQKKLADAHEKMRASIANRSEKTLAADTENATGKTLRFGEALEKSAKAGKAAKAAVSDYQQMLARLNEDLRAAIADGDQMQMLLTDPKFLKMTGDEQAELQVLLTKIQEVNAANQERRNIEAQNDAARKQAEDSLIAERTAMENLVESAKNLADPLREIRQQYEALAEARAQGYFEGNEDAWAAALENLSQKAKDALSNIDPLKKQMDELKQAVEGFGRQASDAFVEFIFQTGETKKSFGEMVAAMLQDLAKLLVYRNVFEPLVGKVNSLFDARSGGGLLGWLGGLLGRQSGGPVNAGQVYRVNENPLRSEFFVPNVPGAVRTSEQMGGGVGDVNVNVYVTRSETTTDVNADTAQGTEFGKRLQAVIRQVIAQERRTGGLLSPT